MGKHLSLESIDQSQDIQTWLTQFSVDDILTVKSLLSRLEFISRKEYSVWLTKALSLYSDLNHVAIYSVRKFREEEKCLWQEDGKTQPRPASTQGSEDFVSSIISNANRQHDNCFLDNPSLPDLRKYRVRDIILVDDSIGSGKRISDFIRMMTNSKTFLSWWSFGFIMFHIVSYARTIQSERFIQTHLVGSDHGKRKYRVSSKLEFNSYVVYDVENKQGRWGDNSQSIQSLCISNKKIEKRFRQGFGEVMGNIIFYHSVPNNVPGILFQRSDKWRPLFPGRVLPEWLITLLENQDSLSQSVGVITRSFPLSNDLIRLLQLVKTGVRKEKSLAYQLECDIQIVQRLINSALSLGLIIPQKRLTKAGKELLARKKHCIYKENYNYSLYIPQSWCVDQGAVQPSDDTSIVSKTDSIAVRSMDGDDKVLSLERTDATATMSPIKDVTQHPSWASEAPHPSWPHGHNR